VVERWSDGPLNFGFWIADFGLLKLNVESGEFKEIRKMIAAAGVGVLTVSLAANTQYPIPNTEYPAVATTGS